MLYMMSPEDKDKIITELDEQSPNFKNEKGEHLLNGKWVLWFHSADVSDWSLKGYKKYGPDSSFRPIETVEDFWRVYNDLPSINNRDMWFLMREGIPPRWEDPINKEGGSYKFRIPGNEAENIWLRLSVYLVTENMCNDPKNAMNISGISVSPKRNGFVTISVWNLDRNRTAHSNFPRNIRGINFETSLYEAHKDRNCG